jgi:hypothetical protein
MGVPACLAIIIWIVASTRPVRAVIIVLAASAIMIVTAPMMVTG